MNTYPRVYLTYHGDGNVGIGTPPQVVMGEPVEHLRVSMTDGAISNKAVQEERSACVKVCEELLSMVSIGDEYRDGVADCIAAIRARGQQ
jgi:cation transport ATPase